MEKLRFLDSQFQSRRKLMNLPKITDQSTTSFTLLCSSQDESQTELYGKQVDKIS